MAEYRFRIDVFTPTTLPMKRLAEYMGEFARLLGEPEYVHFVKLDEGSTVLVSRIDAQAETKIARRLLEVRMGEGDPEALRAERRIDTMLATDNAVGQLLDDNGAEIIPSLGVRARNPFATDLSERMGC